MYTGQDDFFPMDIDEIEAKSLKFCLSLISDKGDDPKHEGQALFSFMASVAYLNIPSKEERNYSFLIHTSGKKIDHKADLENISRVFQVLSDKENPKFSKYAEEIWNTAEAKYLDISADDITQYVINNISRRAIIVLNSEQSFKNFGGKCNNPICVIYNRYRG